MACIIKKIKKGKTYYYAVKSARVDGKPRIVWQKYLGTLDDILKKMDEKPFSSLKEVEIFQAGGVAAMLNLVKRIKLVEIIDEFVPKRNQGASVGEYIALGAINRVLDPCSKLQMPDWYKKTVLYRIWGHSPDVFSSQLFWNHMDLIPEDLIPQIQEKITEVVKNEFSISPELLLYDTTNFFTFIATNNKRNSIAQRGRSKQKRNDLRQIGLALLVTKDFQIPLFHRTYEVQRSDRGLFPEMAEEIIVSQKKVFGSDKMTSTLVFDKGNVSEDAIEKMLHSGQDFVCGIPKNTVPEIFEIALDKLQPIAGLSGTKAVSCDLEIWDKKFKAVLAYSESYFVAQLSDITERIQKSEKQLKDFNNNLLKWEKKKHYKRRPTVASVTKTVNRMLSGQHIKDIIEIQIEEYKGIPNVRYAINQEKLDYLIKHDLGRTLLISTKLEWSEDEIIRAYRSLNDIENSFKHLKNRMYLHWQPIFHWTDQKIKVHGLYCVLALLLTSLAHKIIREAGIDISTLEMLEELNDIREVAFISLDKTPKTKRNNNQISLSKMSPKQKKIAEILEIGNVLAG